MILETQGNAVKISNRQLRNAMTLVKQSRRAPFPANSALLRIGDQMKAAHRDYSMRLKEYKETMEELRLATEDEDEAMKGLYARIIVDIDTLIELNAKRVMDLGLHLAMLMNTMLNAYEVETFGEVVSD